jgi:hypothetical protein
MTRRPLFWQTVLLLAPVGLLLLWGVPIVAVEIWRVLRYSGMAGVPEDGWLGVLRVVAGLLSVCEVIRLAHRTIRGEKYRVGASFVFAVLCGGIASSYLERLFGLAFAVVVAAPAVVLVARLLRVQNEI